MHFSCTHPSQQPIAYDSHGGCSNVFHACGNSSRQQRHTVYVDYSVADADVVVLKEYLQRQTKLAEGLCSLSRNPTTQTQVVSGSLATAAALSPGLLA